MAKRRVNIPLAIILGVVVVGLTAGGIVFAWRMLPKDPQPYVEAAEKAEAEGNWAKAIENYSRAFAYEKDRERKIAWGIRTGDLYWGLAQEAEGGNYYAGVVSFHRDAAEAQERLTRLMLYQAEIYQAEPAWLRVAEYADGLIQIAPDRSFGHQMAGVARYRVGRPDYRKQALVHLEKLRELAPADPMGYYYAALILSARAERADPTGPKHDPEAADKLMEFVPEGAPEPLLSRFRLYQTLYLFRRLPTGLDTLTPEAREEKLKAHLEAVKGKLAQVTDASRMSRAEQAQWATLASRIGQHDVAERIYRSWKNDRAAVLTELENPPVRSVAIEKLMEQSPESLSGCARLAELYTRMGKPDLADKYIELGLSLPTVDKGLLAEVHKSQRCNLMLTRGKRMLADAVDSGLRADYLKVHALSEDVARQYPRFAQNIPEYHRLAGKVTFQLRWLGRAQRHLEAALDLLDRRDPQRYSTERAGTIMLLMEVYRGLNQFGKARDLLRDRLLGDERFREVPMVRVAEARSCMDLRKHAEALNILEKLLSDPKFKDSPLKDEAKRLKAKALRLTGEISKAVELLNEIEGGTGSETQLYREGVAALSEKRDPDAVAKFREALVKNKSFWPAARTLASYHLRNKQKAEAERVLGDFVAANPDHLMAKVELKAVKEGREPAREMLLELIEERETPLQRELRLADEALTKQDKEAAYRHLAEAEKLADPMTLNTLLVRAFKLSVRLRDFDRARQYLSQLEKGDVDGVRGLSYRARLLFAEHRYNEAVAAARNVLKNRQADSYTRRLLAVALLRSARGTVNEAVRLLRQSIEDNPLDPDAWQDLVQVLYSAGRRQEAWREADRGLEMLGRNAYLEQVRLERWGLQNPTKAIEVREQAAKANPKNWRNLLALAELYYGQDEREKGEQIVMQALGNVNDADRMRVVMLASNLFRRRRSAAKGEEVLRKYLDSHPDQPQALMAMAEYLRMLDRPEQAEEYYKRAIEKAPQPGVYLAAAAFYRNWKKVAEALSAIRAAGAAVERLEPRTAAEHESTSRMMAEIQRRLASYQIEFGQLDEAAKTIEQYRKSWPDSPNGDLLEGYLHTRQGRPDQAIVAFDRILQKYPESALAYYRKAQALVRANPAANLTAAITNMQRSVDYDPDLLNGRPSLELAALYLQRGEATQAISIYRKQLLRNPSDQTARLQLIRVLNGERRDQDVNKEITEALKLFPDVAAFYMETGRVAMRHEKFAEAEGHYRQALKLDPDSEAAALGLSRSLAAQERWQAILDESAEWLKRIGKSPRIHLERARALEQLDRKEEMLSVLEQAVEDAGGSPQLLLQLAIVLRNSAGQSLAERWLNNYVSKHSDQVNPRLMRAQFLATSGKPDEAIADLEALAKTHTSGPDAVNIHFNMAIISQQKERYPEAARHFKKVLELAGDNASPVVLNNYAYLLADNMGRAAEGIVLAEKAAAATNRDANVLDTLGWCHILAGQVKKGLDILEEARQQEDLPILYYHMARGYKSLDQIDNARVMNDRAISLADRRKDEKVRKLAGELAKSLRP